MNNPLLTMDSLPPFSQIQPDQVQPAVTQAIADCKQKISDVLAQRDSHTWDSLIAPLEEVNDRLARVWSPVSHLNSVLNSEALRAALAQLCALHSDRSVWTRLQENAMRHPVGWEISAAEYAALYRVLTDA